MFHMKNLHLAQKSVIGKWGGVKSRTSYRMSFFRGVKVRVDEKWTWGEGWSKKAENGWTSFVHGPLHRKEAQMTFLDVNLLCLEKMHIEQSRKKAVKIADGFP